MKEKVIKTKVKPVLKYLIQQIKRELARLGYHSRPSFIIIGAQKAGTSALFNILRQHPQIVPPAEKEVHFFHGLQIKYGDFPTYHSMFPLPYRLGADKITFEASPNYLCRPECAQRIYEYAPDIKLLAILRNPVERAFSAWNMYRGFANSADAGLVKLAEYRSFEDAITEDIRLIEQAGGDIGPCTYVRRGMYAEQLQRYLAFFPRDSILILDYDDFLNTPDTCLASVCQFLNLDEFKFCIEFSNVSTYESNISKTASDLLRCFYTPHNESLFRLLGKVFEW